MVLADCSASLLGQLNSYAEHCSAWGDLSWLVFGVHFEGPLLDILSELVALLAAAGEEQRGHSRPLLERETEALKQPSGPCQPRKEQNPKVLVAYSSSLPLSKATSASISPLCT